MSVQWRNAYYAVVSSQLPDNGRPCFKVVRLNGEDTGKYAFSEKKAIEIARRLTPGAESPSDILSCPLCKDQCRWNHHHVYVIELDSRVLKEKKKKMLKKNQEAKSGAPCFYVGSSMHKCECRYEQHRLFSQGVETFPCDCYRGVHKIRWFRAKGMYEGTRGNTLAGRYGVRLRPDLYAHLNPVRYKTEARRIERRLAEALRAHGAAVIQA